MAAGSRLGTTPSWGMSRKSSNVQPRTKSGRFMRSLDLTLACLLVVGAGIAAGDRPVPGWMMRPRPAFFHGPSRHRAERARLRAGSFIHVDDETDEHHQSGNVVQHVGDRRCRPSEGLRKPHRQTGNQKHYPADYKVPEVN